MSSVRPVVSVVIPIFNEQECLPELWRRLKGVEEAIPQYGFEYIFVDDGSVDDSLNILREIASLNPEVKVISLSRNFGHDIAVTAGCDYAHGDLIVLMDGDLQDPPELITDMLRVYQDGYDVVYAKRRTRQGESFIKLKGAQIFYWLVNKLSSVRMPENTSNFRLITRKVLKELQKMREHDPIIRGMVTWIGLRQKAIEFDRKPRFAGTTKYSPLRMIKLAADGIVSLSNRPLHFATFWGVIFFAIMLVCFVLAFIYKNEHQVYAALSLIVSILFFIGAIELFAIGIVGEYIARIHNNTRGRPLYIVSEEINIQ
ncbi:MAG: glycosyltransferase family 2 protein [Thermodesulfovibrionales bacterium]